MDRETAVELLSGEARRVVELAGTTSMDRPVPSCPEWDFERLLEHLSMIYNWAGTIVADRLSAPPARDQLPGRSDDEPIADWLNSRADRVVEALETVPEDALIWNFVAPEPASPDFWWRRQLHETIIHRVDAELAAGVTITPVAPELASDNISELLELRRFARIEAPLASGDEATGDGTAGAVHPLTIHLHATDVSPGARCGSAEAWSEWTLDTTGLTVSNAHAKGDAAVRGPAWSLALWMWGRGGEGHLERFGDSEAAEDWRRSVGM